MKFNKVLEANLIDNMMNEVILIEILKNKSDSITNLQGNFYENDDSKEILESAPYNEIFCLLEEFLKSNKNMKNSKNFKIIDSLINSLCFLQMHGIVHFNINPKTIFFNKTEENVILFDFSRWENIISQWGSIKTILKTSNKDYISPEKRNLFENSACDIININPYKSDSYSFGLVLLEMLTKIHITEFNEEQLDIILLLLKIEISIKYVKNEKYKMEKIFTIISNCLKTDDEKRWDFIRVFKENIDVKDNKKLRLHIMIEDKEKIEKLQDIFEKCMIFIYFCNTHLL